MAKNDKILIDGIIDDRVEIKLPSTKRDEVFEYLAFEQILKDYDLSKEEIEHGSVDGRNDGGIDGFFILVNGHPLVDPESFSWPRAGSQLEVWIITCKLHDTFKQAPLDNLVASLSELFDLGIENNDLRGDYSELILNTRENLKLAYRKLSPRLSSFNLNFSYASRGDSKDVGESIVSRGEQIVAIAQESFGACTASFNFFGSTELINLHRKVPNYSLELPFYEVLSRGEKYVLLANLSDYYNFISDNGKLRRYLFDSNVRDFMGLNRVNEDIKLTLKDDNSPDFWSMNNGVTILTTSASVIGKSIQLQDIQIVNGLQTTESIFRHFEAGGEDINDRSVLVKIIVSSEDSVRDSIIRATNNQTDVETASLHATDKIQRDIEDVLERSGFYYERRKNHYINMGHSQSQIINPLYIASGFVSLILKSPHKATGLKQKFMRSDEAYEMVFSEKTNIEVWPKITAVLKIVDEALDELRPTGSNVNERFLKRWRQLTSLLVVSKVLGKFDFSPTDLAKLDIASINVQEVKTIWEFLISNRPNALLANNWRKKSFHIDICREAATEFSISNPERVERANDFQPNPPKKPLNKSTKSKSDKVHKPAKRVSLEFAHKVNEVLPEQPWKPGVHRYVTEILECTVKEYFSAVKILIEEGLRNKQKDGIVYDIDGNVICFDEERVNPQSMELIEE
ncbi:AIPR family protein [Pseudoalteromonas sp. 5Ae-yellow]|uniref:AIPR family protein n=1 Tax=Pseudoalteromonas sp. 5Ae-yellow TaxID=2759847 RepID=UPI0015F6945C|nr:AIPR family protein [Pseudoalteromonas sp. 5Ae-yellow]MBA6407907.1 AIPR family protein [Pseudoalteromonas sp. 5Ae-yellow]